MTSLRFCPWSFLLCLACAATPAELPDETSSETTDAEGTSSDGGETTTGEASTGADTSTGAPESPREIAPGVYTLDGIDFDLPYDDLAPLGERVGDAELVALGEAIHTSDGFLRTKARVVRYLVEAHGFRAVSLETPWADAQVIADYVQTCDGDPNAIALRGAFYVFADESFVEMLQWLCAWNQQHPDDRVTFFGWDTQQPWADGARLRAYLDDALPREAVELYAGIDPCNGVGTSSYDDYLASPDAGVWSDALPDEAAHAQCLEGLAVLRSVFASRREELVVASSAAAYDWAEISLVGVESWEGNAYWFNLDTKLSYESRDIANAQVILRMRELVAPAARTVVLAHNVHILEASTDLDWPDVPGPRMTGTVLAEQLGDAYVSFGMFGYRVGINWGGIGELPLPGEPNALERLLHTVGEPYLFVDLRHEGGSPLGAGKVFVAGSEQRGPIVVDAQFDGLVFIDHSEPMTPADP